MTKTYTVTQHSPTWHRYLTRVWLNGEPTNETWATFDWPEY